MKAMYGTDSMGQTAENVAEQYGVSRDDQDAFAVRSQQKAAAGALERPVRDEIVAGRDPAEEGRPEAVRRRTSSFVRTRRSRRSAKLKPAFRTDGKGS